MAYTPTNNPYMPGDPYSYDLKWIVARLKSLISANEAAINAANSAEIAQNAADSIKSVFVTPEMFGAKGDGITNDTDAIKAAAEQGKPIIGQGTYFIEPGIVMANIELFNIKFKFDAELSMTEIFNFTNCKIIRCSFESENIHPSLWNGTTGLYSNAYISVNSCLISECYFKALASVSLGADSTIIEKCIFEDCASGITGVNASHIRITDCFFSMLNYAGQLEHTIYAGNDCADWIISGIISSGCAYYPIHTFNSHSGENPSAITVVNSAFYNAIWAIANNGSLKVINCLFDNSNNEMERFLFSQGNTTFEDCEISGNQLLYSLSNDVMITFKNCDLTFTKLIADFGSVDSTAVNLTLENCKLKGNYICNFNRSFNLISKNNHYSDYTQLISNTVGSVRANIESYADIFVGAGDIIYAESFALRMIGTLLDYASAAIVISARSTSSGCTAFLSNCNAITSGNYISYNSGITNQAKNNCFNINP